MIRMQYLTGFSLLELITVLCIIGILIAGIIPSYQPFLMRIERETTLDQLKTAIEYARQEALIQGKTITLCASINQRSCHSHDWGLGFIVFENAHHHKHPKGDQILQVFPALKYGKLYFEEFGQHLNIEADGTTINAGIFTYCPKNGNRREADGLIINKACRTYRPVERNSQGILIKKSGTSEATPLTCL